MADGTHIEWTGATWNPITGCSIESTGCQNCYAQTLAAGRLQHHPSRAGLTKPSKTGPVWTGAVRFNEQWLDQPLRWTKPRDIFVVAHGDLFYENVPDEWIDRVFAVMALAPQHRYQVLTKRTERMRDYAISRGQLSGNIGGQAVIILERFESKTVGSVTTKYPAGAARCRDRVIDHTYRFMPNVWLGTSVERQQEADKRREPLAALAATGWNTWVSYEPALGPVDWSGWEFIRWLVSGGESGPKARPAHPSWYIAARDFCCTQGIKYFHKQNGNWLHNSQADADGRVGFYGENENGGGVFDWPDGSYSVHLHKKVAGSFLDGREWTEMPARG